MGRYRSLSSSENTKSKRDISEDISDTRNSSQDRRDREGGKHDRSGDRTDRNGGRREKSDDRKLENGGRRDRSQKRSRSRENKEVKRRSRSPRDQSVSKEEERVVRYRSLSSSENTKSKRDISEDISDTRNSSQDRRDREGG